MLTQRFTQAHVTPAACTAAEPLRIAIVARDRISGVGLVTLLGGYEDLAIEQLDADDFLASRIRTWRPDAILCDGELPAVDTAAVVLLDDPALAVDTLAAGARGVLLRDAAPSRIRAALIAVAEGTIVIDDSLAGTVLQHAKPMNDLIEPLTHRELEVMQLLASGQTNKEIANRLGVTEHTVKFHVNGILGKLGVATRTEAVVHAARLGIVML